MLFRSEKLYHALDAMGYSDRYSMTGTNHVDEGYTGLARQETKARSGEAMLNLTKGKL